jgi:excisionase family DNA binding protein
MKWITVKEYHELTGIKLATIYKQIAEGRIKYEKKFGKLVVAYKEKQIA